MLTKRVFIAVDLPENVKAILKNIQKPEVRWIKWMKPDNFHITLIFLGDVDEEQIDAAKKILAETISFTEPFSLKLGQLHKERDMLWFLPEDNFELLNLQSHLQSTFRKERLAKRERRHYSPHVLLGKSKTGRAMENNVTNEFQPFDFRIERINLYESELTPGAATHILLESFPLAGSA